MKIGIVGYGHVGSAMHELFKNAIIYDKYKNIGTIEEINECDVTFVCVPTPMAEDGSCDTSIVEDVVSWCECKCIVLRSTVRIGFTREMAEKYKKTIVFQPEYYGETVAHPFANLSDRNWLTFGGTKEGISIVIKAYQTVINSNTRIYQCTSDEAEMAKYMTNSFLALKVIYCNEMFDLCNKLGIDYNMVRDLWTADSRIGFSHTFVYEDDRGFGGSCFPKDANALLKIGEEQNLKLDIIKAMLQKNEFYKNKGGKNGDC